MKVSWGVGVVVAVLLSLAAYLFGFTNPSLTLSLFLLLSGLWTLIVGLFLVDRRERTFYSAWGVVVAILSLFAYLPIQYTIGLILVAVVALILITAYSGRSGKMYAATSQSAPSSTGESPAADQG